MPLVVMAHEPNRTPPGVTADLREHTTNIISCNTVWPQSLWLPLFFLCVFLFSTCRLLKKEKVVSPQTQSSLHRLKLSPSFPSHILSCQLLFFLHLSSLASFLVSFFVGLSLCMTVLFGAGFGLLIADDSVLVDADSALLQQLLHLGPRERERPHVPQNNVVIRTAYRTTQRDRTRQKVRWV